MFICKGAAFKSSYLISALEQGSSAYLCEEALADELAQVAPETPCIVVDDIRRSMAYVSAQAYNHPDQRLQIFGITGTKGKSTTSYMLKSIFEATGRTPSILGSIKTDDGIESFESHNTTPEAPDLWRHLSNTEQAGRDTVVMEVSSQALKYDRTLGLSFTVGCFLNMERDHISPVEHENFNDYFSSKLKLFTQSDTVVINLNSNYEQEIVDAAQKNKRVVTFGVNRPEADYCALNLCAHEGRVEFDLIEKTDKQPEASPIHISLGMAGLFNVENALAAIAMARVAKISFEHITTGLKHVHVPGRMELVVTPDKHIVAIVDYAHNKLSFETLFKSVKAEYPDRKIISVFGAAGNKPLERRRDLPQVAAAYSDLIIFTEVDPAYEHVEDICAQLAQNTPQDEPYEIIYDRESAIKRAVEAADVPSVVLVLGKGDETFQHRDDEYVKVKSDLEITRELLLEQENA